MTLTNRLLLPRPPSFIISAALLWALTRAGTRPEAIVVTKVIPTMNANTRASIVNRTQYGNANPAGSASMARVSKSTLQ